MNILVVSAHPDDAELAIGGTMLTHSLKGDHIYLLNLTNGEPTPHGTAETRVKEAKIADKILKIKNRVILDFPNRYLQDKIEYREKIAEYIREFRPAVLLIPYHQDAHPDHIAASSLALSARFYAKFSKSNIKGEPFYPPKMIYYFCSHMKSAVNPSFILPVLKNVFEKKIQAVKAYKSQFSYGSNKKIPDHVEITGKYFGVLINSDYGEPFYTPEAIGIKNMNCLV